MEVKNTLRKSIGKTLKLLDLATLKKQSAQAVQKLVQLEQYKKSSKIAFYMSMNSGELQTNEMISQAFKDGKRIFLPNISALKAGDIKYFPTQKRHLKMLEVISYNEVLNLQPRGKYNLKEPVNGYDCLSDYAGLDLIVLPGVGFTEECGRLGHGGAFYDAYIKEHHAIAGKIPALVGVGLPDQLIKPSSRLKLEDHDYILDAVIIGDQVFTKPLLKEGEKSKA